MWLGTQRVPGFIKQQKSLQQYRSNVVVRAGQHVPAEEAAAPSKQPPSTIGRVFGAVGNLVFYGVLVGCTSFWVSRYAYSLEDTQQMVAAAEEAEQRLSLIHI